MSKENIDTVNIAVVEDKELTIHWGVQIPLTDTDSYGERTKHKGVNVEFIQAYIESKGHRTCDTCQWYIIDSVREVH